MPMQLRVRQPQCRRRISWPIADLIHAIEQMGLHRGQHFSGDLSADFAGGDEIAKAINLAQVLAEGGEHLGVVSRGHVGPPDAEQAADEEAKGRTGSCGGVGDEGACPRRARRKKTLHSLAMIAVSNAASNMAARMAQSTSQ